MGCEVRVSQYMFDLRTCAPVGSSPMNSCFFDELCFLGISFNCFQNSDLTGQPEAGQLCDRKDVKPMP